MNDDKANEKAVEFEEVQRLHDAGWARALLVLLVLGALGLVAGAIVVGAGVSGCTSAG